MHNFGKSVTRYHGLLIFMHWLMFLGLVAVFGLGLWMVDLPGISVTKLRLFNYHKWLGVSLFLLVLLRILVRLGTTQPAHPIHWSRRNLLAIHLGHMALYGLMIATPLAGYFYSLAAGYPVVWFGVVELPVLIEKDPALKEVLKNVHEILAKAMFLVVMGHIAMAIKHHVIDRDFLLGRMIPGMKAK